MLLLNYSFADCVLGFYSERCEKKCGNCKSGVLCDSKSGLCPHGCQDHWVPPYCTGNIVLHCDICIIYVINTFDCVFFL